MTLDKVPLYLLMCLRHIPADKLDDSSRIYGRPAGDILHGVQREASESEVRGHLSRFIESVNDAAQALSIPTRC